MNAVLLNFYSLKNPEQYNVLNKCSLDEQKRLKES